MKKSLILAVIVATSTSFAQSTDAVNTTTTTSTATKSELDFSVALEAETIPSRDSDNNINGSGTLLRVEPGIKLSNTAKLTILNDFMVRQTSEKFDDPKKAALKERDGLNELGLKYTQKYSLGAVDNRFQTRLIYTADPDFRQKYGAYGNLQFRNYFGMNLGGKFIIDKYVSYLGFREYFLNDDKTDGSRANRLRLRFAPAYLVSDSFKLGFTSTITRDFANDASKNDYLELGLSARYALPSSLTFLFITDFKTHETNEYDSFADRSEAFQDPTLIFNVSYDLI